LLARSPYLAGHVMHMQGQMHVHLMRADAQIINAATSPDAMFGAYL
jgi:hypothetical protein